MMKFQDWVIIVPIITCVILVLSIFCCSFRAFHYEPERSNETGARENPSDLDRAHRAIQTHRVTSRGIPVTWPHAPPDPENLRRAREASRAVARAGTAALYNTDPRENRERDEEEHSPALLSFRLQPPFTEQTCSICIDSFGTSSVTVGECLHIFHTTCLTSWLARESSIQLCPLCRNRFRARAEQTAVLE